jgi:glycerate 2-kinase
MDRTRTKVLLRKIFDAAVAAAHPASCLPPALPAAPAKGRIIVLAAGKAAGSMSEVAERHYFERGLSPERLEGIAVTRHGYSRPTRRIEMIEAGHPVPDAAGLAATERVLALAQSATETDLVLVLLSGGASANWIAPAPGVSLDDKRALTRALLASGADIREINAVRKHLSRIKGGRLAALAARAKMLTLAISDVPGDDPSVIGSGPTVPDPSTLADAETILRRRKVETPPPIARALREPANETPKPGAAAFTRGDYCIIARPADALAAAARAAREEGFIPVILDDRLEGEAREVARDHARQALALVGQGQRTLLISGGELTVTLQGKGQGKGRGGPNQEYALALALALNGAAGIAAIAGDTDGTDGGVGRPDDPAGAFVDGTTLTRARALGLDAARFLAENNSSGFFERLGDLLAPGPTCTNVNDLRAILVDTSKDAAEKGADPFERQA